MPNISVICTVKNGEKHIKDAVESIMNQTNSYWEFIIVDDGSTDKTPDILNEMKIRDSRRIRIIKTEGIGRGEALNLAIENARGKYIANIDADDLSHPQRLEIQENILDNNEDVVFLSARSIKFTDNNYIKWNMYELEKSSYYEKLERINDKLVYSNPISHITMMARKSILIDVCGYDEKRKSQFDYDLWIRLAEKGYSLHRVPLVLAAKRIHAGQSFENKKRVMYLARSLKVQARAIRKLEGGLKPCLVLFIRGMWGLLPQRLRMINMNDSKFRLSKNKEQERKKW